MAHQAPLKYIFYIAAIPEKVWEGFVSRESNRIIFSSEGRSCGLNRQKSFSTPSQWAKMIRRHAQLSNLCPRPKPPK